MKVAVTEKARGVLREKTNEETHSCFRIALLGFG